MKPSSKPVPRSINHTDLNGKSPQLVLSPILILGCLDPTENSAANSPWSQGVSLSQASTVYAPNAQMPIEPRSRSSTQQLQQNQGANHPKCAKLRRHRWYLKKDIIICDYTVSYHKNFRESSSLPVEKETRKKKYYASVRDITVKAMQTSLRLKWFESERTEEVVCKQEKRKDFRERCLLSRWLEHVS